MADHQGQEGPQAPESARFQVKAELFPMSVTCLRKLQLDMQPELGSHEHDARHGHTGTYARSWSSA